MPRPAVRHLSAYNGTKFIGSITGADKKRRAYDERGRAIPGKFSTVKYAFAAVNARATRSCVADTSARQDNSP